MSRKLSDETWAIIMMAGMGTRMKSSIPKVLHQVCGQSLGKWVIDSCSQAGIKNRVIVVGHQAKEVMDAYQDEIFALQKPQKGTGHAVMVGLKKVPENAKRILILSGDVPCLSSETIKTLLREHIRMKCHATVLSFDPPDPSGYGRVIRDEKDRFDAIIEHKDLSSDLEYIDECNSGIYVFERESLEKSLKKIKPSKRSGEYHLPDVLGQIIKSGGKVEAVPVSHWMEAMGVNTRAELAEAGDYLRWRILQKLMLSGVTVVDPASTWISPEVKINQDTIVEPGTIITGKTSIGRNNRIGPYANISNSTIGDENTIRCSVIDSCVIGNKVRIGPFAHLRPGTLIHDKARVGNFVEMKNTEFGEGSKSGHLTYLGDAKVGNNVNIGAGTITCNYDGSQKFMTVIEDGVFVGSDTILVAPITIGQDAYTAAGSTLTHDVPPEALAFGRSRQFIKEGWVRNRIKKKR